MIMEKLSEVLPDCLISAMKEKGIAELTEIQRISISPILSGKNILIIAPTGSGKTEAALWPILARMTGEKIEDGPILLYVTPLRALNRDLEDRIKFWSSKCGFSVGVRHGDTSKYERAQQSRKPPHILITTPETLLIMMSGPKISEWLKNMRYMIIDEVHELLDDKRGTQLSLSLERLERIIKRSFQRVMLSASLGNPKLALEYFSFGRDGVVVQSTENRAMEVKVLFPKASQKDVELSKSMLLEPDVVVRLRVLADLIRDATSAIVFTNTRSMAETLGYRMKKAFEELKVHVHHSSLSKDARVESEFLLKTGELSAVISTSSLELGIDVGHVDLVVQYGSPRQAIKLLQRVGRSGHGPGRVAKGVIIAQDADDYLESIVLARRALQGELEYLRPMEKSYDVLYHSTIGLLLREKTVSLKDLVDMARRSWPYRDLTIEEIRALFSFMSKAWPRMLWYDQVEDSVKRHYGGESAHEYFFSNVSTIPDTVSYPVIDDATGFYIGQLDEAFVLEYLLPGVKFVFRGSVWKVNRIESGRIYVEQAFDPAGAIPSWIGEQLPVERETSLEVGSIRRLVEERGNKSIDGLLNELEARYPSASRDGLARALATVADHIEGGYPLPTDKRIVVEGISGSGVVIHSTNGSLVNRTLGRALSFVVSRDFKVAVRVAEDPYRIVMIGVSEEAAVEAIHRLTMEGRDTLIEAIKNSSFFRIRLLQVAKRMGLVRDTANSKVISLSKLAKAYEGTPVYEEALRESITKDFDVEGTLDLLKSISTGELRVTVSGKRGPSPLSLLGLERSELPLEIIPPSELSKKLLESFKYRILSQQITLVCSICWRWSMDTSISNLLDLGKVPRCPVCGSSRIAALSGYWASEAKEYVEESKRRGRPSIPNWELANKVYEFGLLTERYGMPAIVAMAARGVDPIDVEQHLSRYNRVDEDFMVALAKVETEAVKRRLISRRRRRRRENKGL